MSAYIIPAPSMLAKFKHAAQPVRPVKRQPSPAKPVRDIRAAIKNSKASGRTAVAQAMLKVVANSNA